MGVERAPATASLVDLLDRVLDRGVVLDPWVRATTRGVSLAGRTLRVTSEPARPARPASRPRPRRRPAAE